MLKMTRCWLLHDWPPYEAPQVVAEHRIAEGIGTVAQRRECKRCKAVDYRRVLVHN